MCKDETPDCGRLLEINTSIEGKTYFIQKTEDEELIISPWIFSDDAFELTIEERILQKTQFTSNLELESDLIKAKPQFKTCKLKKATK